jgi:response regulator RpfG family c-di-GMP phosphodiesterase
MTPKVLFVDDDPNVLAGYQRTLRRQFQIETVDSGKAALELIDGGRSFAVIVSDMRMPGMDGLELLRTVKSRTHDSVRVMVTGNTDQQTAVAAINEGDVFRFLTKPCDPQVLIETVQAALDHYRLVQAEKELLEGTLAGAVGALGEALGLVNAEAFGRGDRMKALLEAIAPAMGYGPPWAVSVLATLSQLGCVVLPDGTLRKLSRGQKLSEEERQIYEMTPSIAANMIEKIPRLGDVAEAIRMQQKNFDGTGVPHEKTAGTAIPLGARLLKVVGDFVGAESTGLDPAAAMQALRDHAAWYDPTIVQVLADHLGVKEVAKTAKLSVAMLSPGMVLARDLVTKHGQLLLRKDQVLQASARERLLSHLVDGVIDDGVEVYVGEHAG